MKQRTIEKNFANSAEMYSLNQEWNAFLVLYEFKNFSTAAKKLGITQSALSKCIKKLEAKLQIRLFDRNTRPITPTTDANILYEGIFDKVLKIEEIISKVKSHNYLKPVFRFGCTEATCRYIVPAIAKRFSHRVSKFIEVTDSSDSLIDKLIKRELDIVFVCEAFEEIQNLDRTFIFREPSILILYEIESDSVMIEMIKEGLGWSLSRPSTLLSNYEQKEQISIFALNKGYNHLNYYVVTRKDEFTNESLEISKICKQTFELVIKPKFENMASWIAEECEK